MIVAAAIALTFTGCILDAFKELVQNLSVDRTFTLTGNTNSIPKQTQVFKLTDSQVYNDNKGKIKKLRYKAAAFCVTENSVPALQGDIILTLKAGTGTAAIPLFTKTLTGFKPNDYLGIKAKDLNLTDTEIAAINSYISNSAIYESITFTADLSTANVTPASTSVTMKCFVSLAMEMTVDLEK